MQTNTVLGHSVHGRAGVGDSESLELGGGVTVEGVLVVDGGGTTGDFVTVGVEPSGRVGTSVFTVGRPDGGEGVGAVGDGTVGVVGPGGSVGDAADGIDIDIDRSK